MTSVKLKKYGTDPRAIIAFPGWTHPIENEQSFLNLLSKKYTVYSLHLPGYMSNPDSKLFLTFSDLVKETQENLEKITSKEVIYIGFSMGCRLIMEFEKTHAIKSKKIFVGCPIKNYDIPLWANPLLFSSYIINVLRKVDCFKRFVVNIALRVITGDNSAVLSNGNVTLTGAFDSLIGLIKTQSLLQNYTDRTMFIYGEDDAYLRDSRSHGIKNLKVIPNVGHNCVNQHEVEVINIINQFIRDGV